MPVELAKVDELITFPLHFISANTFTVAVYEWFKLKTFVEENQKLIFDIFGISDPLRLLQKLIFTFSQVAWFSTSVLKLVVIRVTWS